MDYCKLLERGLGVGKWSNFIEWVVIVWKKVLNKGFEVVDGS